MEDVLDVYQRPFDPKRPLVCIDEMPKQLLMDTREPLTIRPGASERFDYEYKRGGVADLFMLLEPLAGKRHIEITDQRRRVEWAEVMRIVSDELYPDAEKSWWLSIISTPMSELLFTWLLNHKKPDG